MKSLIKKIIPKSCLLLYHKLLAMLAAVFYGFPSRKMIVIGVTGTNGKTTVCHMIAKILEGTGYKVGMSTSIDFKIADKVWPNNFKQTMLGRFKLRKLLKLMNEAGCQYVIIETTSEGIMQYRHFMIDYNLAVLTNVTRDHLEAHGSFEKYRQAKEELFKLADIHIINLDDPNAKHFLKINKARKKYKYGIKNGLRPEWIKDSKFKIFKTEFRLNLLGRFNIYNALAAICVGHSQKIPMETIKKALEAFKAMPGRLEEIKEGQNFRVFVDYAHSEDALKIVYETLSEMPHEKIISVLGATGGGRDKQKRPILGHLADQYTDYIIITNEDPYDENPMEIIKQVAWGVKNKPKELILDRKEAIKKALSMARKNDIVIITGKGAEQVMAVAGDKLIPWDDRKIVRELLKD